MRRHNTKRRALLSALAGCFALVAFGVVAFVPTPAGAQDGTAGTQSVFSTLGAGSRGMSLGRSFVSLADDASAIYWNPAALKNVRSRQFMGMYMPLFGDFSDATYTFLGAAYPTLSAGAYGIGFMRVGSNFEGFDDASVPTGTQEYSETQVLIGYAFEQRYPYAHGSLATGFSFKIANQKIASRSSTAPGIDLGFRYQPDFIPRFSLGINFQDLVGPKHRLDRELDETARTILAGVGYTHVLRNGSALRLLMQLDMPERAGSKFHVGAEYTFARYAALRLGMDDGNFTFGLGVTVREFGLDFAFVNRETAGSSQPVSFTAPYGATLYEQEEALAKEQKRRDQALLQRVFARRVGEHRENARRAETDGHEAAALDEWKIVLEYMPGDEEATQRMEMLTQHLVEAQEAVTRNIENRAAISERFEAGLQLYQDNDYVRSRREWFAILALDSTHADARAYLKRTQEKIDETVADHVAMAGQLEKDQRLTEAMGEWHNVQILDPGNADAEAALDRIRDRIQTQSQSLAQTERRLQVVNLYNAALQAFDRGDYQGTLRELEGVFERDPEHREARQLRAMATRKLTPLTKEEEQAIRRFFLQGMQHFSKDRYLAAIREWDKILKIDPTNRSVKKNIEEARERLKQLERP
ncbi:MAG: hypothetical protein ACE5EO_04150 [Candidatus Krumholzibacteriia bacterium]